MKIEIRTVVDITGSDDEKNKEAFEYVRYLRSLHVNPLLIDKFLAGEEVTIDRVEKDGKRIIKSIFQLSEKLTN